MIPLDDIRRARETIAGAAVRMPLVRFPAPEAPCEIWLKLENLQPIGSFKIRGAVNAVRQTPKSVIANGVLTASAGNMAQGVAWAAREAGVEATIAVPETAPQTKLDAIERLGGKVMKMPFADWWRAIVESRIEGVEGHFVHPVQDPLVMAGNGTIGLEIVEDLPDVDTVACGFGGGGLSTGIASAVKALEPGTRLVAVQPETAAALVPSFAAGHPVAVDHTPSFVDGAGAGSVLEPMWPLVREAVDEAVAVTLDETAAAVRLIAERCRVIAEGAGALPVAAALAGKAGSGKVVCVVSGGNIDFATLRAILSGRTPD